MFTLSTIHTALPFLHSIDVGVVTLLPELRYCQIMYDSHYYQDALFRELEIPFPEILNNASVKRRAEYVAARYAAKLLLDKEGCHDSVGSASSRAPIWPDGWGGSLSHTDQFAIALMAPLNSALTLGVDIEMLISKSIKKTAHIFTTPLEQTLLAACNISYETALLITFSSKESAFKALYPEVNRSFGFEATRVCQIDMLTRSITLELTQTLSSHRAKGSLLTCYFDLQDDKVITFIAEPTMKPYKANGYCR
ncbi:4'-phosphopantetheinyl transferase family protein [Hafnia paralvei]|uniref:4'-phosphopantetheinyl transferase family protein n=1 Tax=Hafnia paralvei TaxID=546367 RepID=UPI00107BF99A|nr:4'-phosphopantetheinyl transferase superfamily protein [Hafnia paralvei]